MNIEQPNSLDVEVLKQFRIVFRSVRKHFQSVEHELGISGAQLWALSEIDAQPGLTLSVLAKAMSLHQSTTSNLVEKLVSSGLVERKRSSQDARSVRLYPTQYGADKLSLAPHPVKGLLPDALGRLPAPALARLHESLSSLLDTMSQLELDAGESNPLSDH
ncbi:MarR family winged helix-turn-helix transcriptional regulator [Chitinibacter sp. GC72]|uniref:MarR family winged helix-turn-helix transcriptional regulator n=1 Tax=Chitinibacter sp. GC72 TaxID=1526917 RepID=UPI0012F76586|nr:MarR family transcriptional regulator [Chitinibacter sp. GC72]